MKDKTKLQCLKLMDKMMARPLCALFLGQEGSLFFKQRQQRRKSVSLERIRASLIKGEYSGIREWSTVVTQWFESMMKASRNPNVRAIVTDMLEWFGKRSTKLVRGTSGKNEWINKMSSGYSELVSSLMRTSEIESLAEFKHRLTTKPDEPLYFPLESSELKRLAMAVSMITDDEIMTGGLAIIKTIEGTANERMWIGRTGDIVVHLESCSPQTHHALKEYVERKFREMGMKYPE